MTKAEADALIEKAYKKGIREGKKKQQEKFMKQMTSIIKEIDGLKDYAASTDYCRSHSGCKGLDCFNCIVKECKKIIVEKVGM